MNLHYVDRYHIYNLHMLPFYSYWCHNCSKH